MVAALTKMIGVISSSWPIGLSRSTRRATRASTGSFLLVEMIFTSMDSRPITNSRFKNVEPHESELWMNIHKLAREVFLEFNLGTLIRIDLRADANGKLHILEANPKPDLKYPTLGVTSLVSAGLSQTALGYDDLLLSLLGIVMFQIVDLIERKMMPWHVSHRAMAEDD